VLLTKVTPGIGLLWFAARREWRQLGVALGVTAAIMAFSFAIAPDLWVVWLERLLATASAGPNPTAIVILDLPLVVRVAVAAVAIVIAARLGWGWLLLAATFVAQPAVTLQRASMILVAPRADRRPRP